MTVNSKYYATMMLLALVLAVLAVGLSASCYYQTRRIVAPASR